MKAITFTTTFIAIILISIGSYAQTSIGGGETTIFKTHSVSYGKFDTTQNKFVYYDTKPDTFYFYTINDRIIKTPTNSYHTFKGAKDDFLVDTDSIKVAYEELEDAFGVKCKRVVTMKYFKNIPKECSVAFEYKTHAFRYNLIMPKQMENNPFTYGW